MKKTAYFLLITLSVLIGYSFLDKPTFTLSDYTVTHYPNGINIPGYSGAPGEYNCGDCHNCDATPAGLISRFSIKDSLGNLITSYTPNCTYTIDFTDTILGNKGFQCTVLNESNEKAGNLIAGLNTQISTLLNSKTQTFRQYINHTDPFRSTWKFQWKAPSTFEGNITFYFSTGNYQNIYLSNYTVQGQKNTTGVIENMDAFHFLAFYSENSKKLFVRCNVLTSGNSSLNIVDISGKTIYRAKLGHLEQGVFNDEVELPVELKSGYYTVQMFVQTSFATQKIYIP